MQYFFVSLSILFHLKCPLDSFMLSQMEIFILKAK
jgi:hypothetical protein